MKIPIRIGMVTMVGYHEKDFPTPRGNCFSLVHEEKDLRVVNFHYENFEEVQKRFNLNDVEVELVPKSTNLITINDDRIPPEWYRHDWCTICTPLRMLPFTQRKEHLKRQLSRGAKFMRTVTGTVIVSIPIGNNDNTRRLSSTKTSRSLE